VSNGGEGDLGAEPGWIAFWPAEEVIALNDGYEVAQWLPGFFGIGSNGGGELIAFDTRGGEPYPVVMVPFDCMDVAEAVHIAASFESFRELIGKPAE
jgi:SMI1/KNR4 family protein SUKH-1